LWFANRFEGGVATYNMPTAFRISGELDVEALAAALDDVVARHESLRTVFPDIDGVPFQQVLPAQPGMWRCGDAQVVALHEQDVVGELMALAVTGSTCRRRSRFAPRSTRPDLASMCSQLCCTTSRLMDGHWPRCFGTSGWRMRADALGLRPAGPNCRCNMWITRCGTRTCWVQSLTRTA